jgi:hypothetical protein
MDNPQPDPPAALGQIDVEAKRLLLASVMLAGPTMPADARAALTNVANLLVDNELSAKCREAAVDLSDAELLPFCKKLSETWRTRSIAALKYVEAERNKGIDQK